MRAYSILTFTAFLAGCSSMNPVEGDFTNPPILSDPDIIEVTPVSIDEPQEGSDSGFTKGDGFFFTIGEGAASLGDVSQEGLWVKASFVENNTTVEIHSAKTKTSVLVEAIHGDGFMQMSLAAFQALGLSPADLPTIEVRTP